MEMIARLEVDLMNAQDDKQMVLLTRSTIHRMISRQTFQEDLAFRFFL